METLRFKLDEEWYDLPDEMKSFGALRDWVNSRLKDEGRVLLGVMSGDATLMLEEIEDRSDWPLGQFDTLNFFSADPGALACRTCGDLIEFMDVLEERGGKVRACIEAENFEAVALHFKGCIEGWNLVFQGLRDLIQVTGLDSSTLEIGNQPLSDVAGKLRGIILKMAEDFTRGDMVSLNTRLIEELAEYIHPLQEVFERVRKKFEEAAV